MKKKKSHHALNPATPKPVFEPDFDDEPEDWEEEKVDEYDDGDRETED